MTTVVTTVGSYVLDTTAKHAVDTGSTDDMGVRGIVVQVHADWVDGPTGEKGDLYVVATRRHGQLRFEDVMASGVGDSWPCGRIDAGGYIGLVQREIARARRGNVDPRLVDLLALCTRVKESAASPHIGGQAAPAETLLERADRERAADPALTEAFERMQDGINRRRAERGATAL